MTDGGAALRIVEQAEIEQAFDLEPALELIRALYRMAASGRAAVSAPAALSMRGAAGTQARFKVKGAVLDDMDVAGFRLICDADPARGGGRAYCYLTDPHSGAPLALVEEEWLHGVRTALTGVVAVSALAPARARRLALIGTGRIARHFARFIRRTHPDLEVTIASRAPDRAAEAARAWSDDGKTPFGAAATVGGAVREAQIVVTLSDARERLFTAEDLAPGALVCAMGGRHEFDRDVLDRAGRFILDEIDFACTAGNVAHWIETGTTTRAEIEARLDATIGDILAAGGDARGDGPAICLAVIQGMAVCDIGMAKWILDRIDRAAGPR